VNRIISKEREDALTTLIDDASPSVHDALLAEFKRLGEPGLIILRHLAKSDQNTRSDAARIMIEELEGISPGLAMMSFIKRGGSELEEGVKIISSAAVPSSDADGISLALDSIAARVRGLLVPDMSILERCKALNRVLFHEYGFRGINDGGKIPANIVISQVLRRRRGMPLALCIVYVLVARRLGMPLGLVDMPGRFMVGCLEAGAQSVPWLIDPFERGAIRMPEQILDILRANDVDPEPAWFIPIADSEVLFDCCSILVLQFSHLENSAKTRLFDGFVKAYESVIRGLDGLK